MYRVYPGDRATALGPMKGVACLCHWHVNICIRHLRDATRLHNHVQLHGAHVVAAIHPRRRQRLRLDNVLLRALLISLKPSRRQPLAIDTAWALLWGLLWPR